MIRRLVVTYFALCAGLVLIFAASQQPWFPRLLKAAHAQMVRCDGGYGSLGTLTYGSGGCPTAAPSTSTWNPSDVGAGVTLASGNLKATGSAANAFGRATTSHASGSCYFEFTVNAFAGNELNVGIASGSVPLSTGDIWNGTNRAGYRYNDELYINSFGAGFQGGATGSPIGLAINFSSKFMWLTLDGMTWTGSGNPVTPSGGLNMSSLTGSPWFPAFVLQNTGTNQITANFGPMYTYSAPFGPC